MEGVNCSKLLARKGISRQQAQQVVSRFSKGSAARPQFRRRRGQLPLSKLAAVFNFLQSRRFDSHLAGSLSASQFFHMSEVMKEGLFQKFVGGLTKLPQDLRTLYGWSCSLASMDKFTLDQCLKEKPASLLLKKCPVWGRWLQRRTGRRFLLEAVTTPGAVRFECTDGGMELPASVAHYCNPLGSDLELGVGKPLPVSCSLKGFDQIQRVLLRVLTLKQVSTEQLIKVYRVANYLNVTPILDLLEERFRDDPFLLTGAFSDGKIRPHEAPPYASFLFRDMLKSERITLKGALQIAHFLRDGWLVRQIFELQCERPGACTEFAQWARRGKSPPVKKKSPFGVEVRRICHEWPEHFISQIARGRNTYNLLGSVWRIGETLGSLSLRTFVLWEAGRMFRVSPTSVPNRFHEGARSVSFEQTANQVAPWLRRYRMLPLRLADQGLLKDLAPLDGVLAAASRGMRSTDDGRANWFAHRLAIQFDLPLTQRCLMPLPLHYRSLTVGTPSFKRDAVFLQKTFERDESLAESGVRGQLTRKVATVLIGSMVKGAVKKKQGHQFLNFLYDLGWKRSKRPELKDLVYLVVRFHPEHASGLLAFTWPIGIRQVRDRVRPFHLTCGAFERVAPYLQLAPDLLLRAAEEKVIPAAAGATFYWNCDGRKKGFDETFRLARLVDSAVMRPHTQPIAEMVQQIRRDLVKNCDHMGPLKQVWAFACDIDDREIKQVCQFFASEFLRLRKSVEEIPEDLVSFVGPLEEFPYHRVKKLYGVRRYFLENQDRYVELVKLKRIEAPPGFIRSWNRLSRVGAHEQDAFRFRHFDFKERLREDAEGFVRALYWGHFPIVPDYAMELLEKQSVTELLGFYCRPAQRTPWEALQVVKRVLIGKIDEDSCAQILQDAVKYHKYELIEACREYALAEEGRLERIWPLGVPEWLEKYLN